MMSRSTFALAALALVSLAGCDTGSHTSGVGGSTNDVLIKVVNTTPGAIDLTANGQVVGGSGHVNAGTVSACIRVDAGTTSLGLREAGATSDLALLMTPLIPTAAYTVVAFTSDAGTTQALSLLDEFVPTSGLAALRIVDVAPGLGSLDVYITPRAGPLGVPSTASIGYGGDTGFFDTDPGPSQVRFTQTTTSTLVFDAGSITLLPGQIATMVLAQPGGPTGTAVAPLAPAC